MILGVGYDDEVAAVVLGAGGLLATRGLDHRGLLDLPPYTVKALDERARAQGVDVLDAPICRGRCAADEGTLLALVGGKRIWSSAGARCTALLLRLVHLGEVGHGQVGKTMNNMLLWVNAIGLIEAGRLARPPVSISSSCARRC